MCRADTPARVSPDGSADTPSRSSSKTSMIQVTGLRSFYDHRRPRHDRSRRPLQQPNGVVPEPLPLVDLRQVPRSYGLDGRRKQACEIGNALPRAPQQRGCDATCRGASLVHQHALALRLITLPVRRRIQGSLHQDPWQTADMLMRMATHRVCCGVSVCLAIDDGGQSRAHWRGRSGVAPAAEDFYVRASGMTSPPLRGMIVTGRTRLARGPPMHGSRGTGGPGGPGRGGPRCAPHGPAALPH